MYDKLNQNYQETWSGDVVNNLPSNTYGMMSLATNHQSRALVRQTKLEVTKMYCTAALTETAINCMGVFSLVEGARAQQMPWAQGRFQAAADMGAYKLIEQLKDL